MHAYLNYSNFVHNHNAWASLISTFKYNSSTITFITVQCGTLLSCLRPPMKTPGCIFFLERHSMLILCTTLTHFILIFIHQKNDKYLCKSLSQLSTWRLAQLLIQRIYDEFIWCPVILCEMHRESYAIATYWTLNFRCLLCFQLPPLNHFHANILCNNSPFTVPYISMLSFCPRYCVSMLFNGTLIKRILSSSC